MKNKILLMKRSAMATRQKYTILSNELTRRLSNCHLEGTSDMEKREVIEQFTRQVKNSGFVRSEAREIVISGIKGWKSRHAKRREEGIPFYRSARSTIGKRFKKKLTEKSNWWRDKKRKLEDLEEEEESPRKYRKPNENKESDKHPMIEKVEAQKKKKE